MKQASTISQELRHTPLLANLNETEFRQLAEITRLQEFKPGDLIMQHGETTQDLWLVLEGTCEVFKPVGNHGDTLVLAVLHRHAILGEMSFFHRAPHSASVRAQTGVKLLQIKRSDYDELIQDGASVAFKLAFNVVETLAERLRRMDQWVEELIYNKPPTEPVPAAAPIAKPQAPQPTRLIPAEALDSGSEWSSFRQKLFTEWNL